MKIPLVYDLDDKFELKCRLQFMQVFYYLSTNQHLFKPSTARMILKLFTVDAFSERAFEGNPAAVVPLTEDLSDSKMQKIAFEMNLSETAFVTPSSNTPSPWTDGSQFGLRWFTPAKEVPLCGHATLATAHTLFNILGNKSSILEFKTLSGILLARKQDAGIVLDFPSSPPKPLNDQQYKKYSPLVDSIIEKNKAKEIMFSASTGKLLIRLDDSHTRADLEAIQPKSSEMLSLNDGSEVKGVIVTLLGEIHSGKDSARGIEDYHFISRYFAPWVGILEDPVTGSAHTVLAPYWAKELGVKDLKCRQCSRRGGDLTLKLRDDARVDIFGKGTTFLQGEISI